MKEMLGRCSVGAKMGRTHELLASQGGTVPAVKESLKASLLFALVLAPMACDAEDDDGETHADHGHGDETSDADAMVNWHTEPPATATVGEAFSAMFMVQTTGEVHTREARICEGADVADCGLGDMGSFTSVTANHDESTGMDMVSITLDAAGDYTIVAYAHIGADPHVSAAVNVSAE